jgi:soluble lytic murein transglycosylase-like protein
MARALRHKTPSLLEKIINAPQCSRCLLRRVVLAAVAALTLVSAAQAQISLRDDGAAGIVLSNVETGGSALATGHSVKRPRGAAAPAGPGAALRRRDLFAPLVLAAADAHGLPAALLQAIIEVESNFNAGAVSPQGAVGLMQLMPETARYLRVVDAHDPAANIDGGARYLKELLARFRNDLPLALAAYNAGPSAVQRNGAIPPYAETQRYVPRVIARYHALQSDGAVH